MSTRAILFSSVMFSLTFQHLLAQQSTTGPYPPPQMPMGHMSTTATQVALPGVPSYLWYNGCGPTAVGMVVGYYDGKGFPDLVQGNASTQTYAVNTMIASTDHYDDYSLPLDYAPNLLPDKSSLGGAHASNCVADFMNTSWSARHNFYGWSWSNDIGPSFSKYVALVNDAYLVVTMDIYPGSNSWSQYKQEIDGGRPVVFLVDSDGDGATDHFVTGIGYDEADSTYGVYNTWDTQIHWYPWHAMKAGSPWGIYDFTKFMLNPPNDNIIVSRSSLPDFGSVIIGTTSPSQTYNVSGTHIPSYILLSVTEGFELSLNNATFGNSYALGADNTGTVGPAPVYVRFSPTLAGLQSVTISHTSAGASPKYVAVSGTGATASGLAIGDTIRVISTTDCVNARSVPSITGSTIYKCEPTGTKGVVLGGPSNDVNGSSDVVFYQIRYADGIQGWSDVSYLEKCGGPLPIQLSHFAYHDGRLEWTTVSETNNFGFFVEKDRRDIPGAFINGNGTTLEAHHYSYKPVGDGYYRLRQVDLDGAVHFSQEIEVIVDGRDAMPAVFQLSQNWPNPFNPSTAIRFALPVASNVKLTVFNSLGEKVAILANGPYGPGYHDVTFDGTGAASGVYFYRIQVGSFVQTRRLLLLK
jgi:hypothetical protein